jgi:hypothetical protein
MMQGCASKCNGKPTDNHNHNRFEAFPETRIPVGFQSRRRYHPGLARLPRNSRRAKEVRPPGALVFWLNKWLFECHWHLLFLHVGRHSVLAVKERWHVSDCNFRLL